MKTMDMKCARLYAKLPVYAKRLGETKRIINDIMPQLEKPYLGFSCGKDSSVVAHLLLSLGYNIKMRFLSSGETRLLHNVDTIIDWFGQLGADIEEINIDRVFSDDWKHASWVEQKTAGRDDMKNHLSSGDWDGVIMGLRADESRARKITLSCHRTDDLPRHCYRYKSGLVRVCPIGSWCNQDVAAYIQEHQIPVLNAYKEKGIGSRTTARLTGDALRQGALVELRERNPVGYQKLISRFPELSAFANLDRVLPG